jgi:hypothetical protein
LRIVSDLSQCAAISTGSGDLRLPNEVPRGIAGHLRDSIWWCLQPFLDDEDAPPLAWPNRAKFLQMGGWSRGQGSGAGSYWPVIDRGNWSLSA